jgi:hypothetical protein
MRALTPKFDRNGLRLARFLCHGNGCPDEMSICLARLNRRMYPEAHFGKLSKKEVPGSVRQWTVVALLKKTLLHLTV